ncbi:MAG: hypothetical protein JRG81_13090 [Deltaproteobacteria bacterium]|nr:hypothetical protein [Deltaproteobacteria bacterium]
MKSVLTMIAALVLFIFQVGEAQAANLKYVRTAKHHNFTRIVFEFESHARFNDPVIDGEGKFSMVFPDSTTVLPPQILYKKTRIQPVHSIELIQKGTLLTAGIKLTFPYFKLKTFSLPGPDRVVIDAYLMTQPPEKDVPGESLHAGPSSKDLKGPETKKPKVIPEKSPVKETKVHASPIKTQSAPAEKATQVQQKQAESLPSTGENYNLQTYMLVLLNLLTIVIILLLGFNMLKKKSGIDSEHLGNIPDSLKTGDESIAAIDAMINKEFKKHD